MIREILGRRENLERKNSSAHELASIDNYLAETLPLIINEYERRKKTLKPLTNIEVKDLLIFAIGLLEQKKIFQAEASHSTNNAKAEQTKILKLKQILTNLGNRGDLVNQKTIDDINEIKSFFS